MMAMRGRSNAAADDVVDDHTYDLLQALTSSLEALDAYREFAANTPGSVFDRLVTEERAQAAALLRALQVRFAIPSGGSSPASAPGSSGDAAPGDDRRADRAPGAGRDRDAPSRAAPAGDDPPADGADGLDDGADGLDDGADGADGLDDGADGLDDGADGLDDGADGADLEPPPRTDGGTRPN